MMLYAHDIALIFDMEPNKTFAVRRFNCENDLIGFFYFDMDKGLRNATNDAVSKNVLLNLLDGEYYIDKCTVQEKKEEKVKPSSKEKFKPRVGERYWYIPLPNHTEKSDTFGSIESFNRSLSSNFFRTREEARKGKQEIIEQYKSFHKACIKNMKDKKKMEGFFND